MAANTGDCSDGEDMLAPSAQDRLTRCRVKGIDLSICMVMPKLYIRIERLKNKNERSTIVAL
jgi:hypothetical protein